MAVRLRAIAIVGTILYGADMIDVKIGIKRNDKNQFPK
jgi:hypothetical protein